MGLRAGGPASRRARFSRQGSDAGHGRVGLLRDRQESSAQFRGNQKRPRAFERRAFLQRSRASGIFDAGMHDPSPDRDSRQSGRTHPGGMCAAPKFEIAEWPGSPSLQNNTDFFGHSYGCHDNYLMQRDVPWDRIVSSILPFLITRQIFAGAGKMGVEGESSSSQPGLYQISSRADFFSVVVSIDTMNRRPLINTRDEPHVDASRYRRFHVILGDSNMSEWATALKIGTTALVLDLIERGQAPQLEI